MYVSSEVAEIINKAFSLARSAHFEYVTPELVLYVACQNRMFAQAFRSCGGSVRGLDRDLRSYLEKYMESGAAPEREPELSQGMGYVLAYAWEAAQNSEKSMVEMPHVLFAMYALPESYAVYYIASQGVDQTELLQEMNIAYEESAYEAKAEKKGSKGSGRRKGTNSAPGTGERAGAAGLSDDMPESLFQSDSLSGKGLEEKEQEEFEDDEQEEVGWNNWEEEEEEEAETGARKGFWRDYAVCLNDQLEQAGPLIGRTEELERTMQILCRKEKNNPLHIGEPGVGKTAITYGLARLLEEGKVPEPLAGAKIFSLDLGSLLAGTQYRGDFEKRFKRVMDSIACEENPVVYIDEIHNIIGAGAVNGGSFDISNMLKPYLAQGRIRFIGATTYEEYKKHFEKSKSLVRRFQNIHIKEPDIPDAIRILEGLKETYEAFHGVRYEEGVLEYAVEMSAKYINERYLPDKAIDLMDEAGAYRRMHPQGQTAAAERTERAGSAETAMAQPKRTGSAEEAVMPPEHAASAEKAALQSEGTGREAGKAEEIEETKPTAVQADRTVQTVDKALIDEILSKTCHIPKQVVESDETAALATLEERLQNLVYGQDEAISQVVNAVKFSRAGLLEEGKPLASLLFVGPTGVGKTEIAKSLARELGIRLIRFDMSEYEEKHAVAKLIGAPAGYVGYEEGGLLTEEIRKNPHAVLLLDEIEKAHPDIYNILLQAMDYATLTDNQGRKADFRNVIIIMTSNAGASRIGKHGIGFQGQDVSADVILEEVKRIFQPEFRNRLNRVVVFRSMDERMAERIVEKKLGELQIMLARKNIEMHADEKAEELVMKKGISVEFGAREIERVIQSEIKPLLVDEILFGALKDGGKCGLTAESGAFRIVHDML
nr:AAA family ATPase [uncultured Acetatifactor sp.]